MYHQTLILIIKALYTKPSFAQILGCGGVRAYGHLTETGHPKSYTHLARPKKKQKPFHNPPKTPLKPLQGGPKKLFKQAAATVDPKP